MAKKGVLEKSLLRLTWPIFIELFFVFMVNVADAWFLSRVSDAAAGAVGAILPIIGIGFAIYSTLNQSGNAVASQRLGAKDHHLVAETFGVVLILGLISGLLLAVMYIYMAPTFARLMGLEGDMADMASIYLGTLGFGTWLLSVRFAASSILSSQGLTKWNMLSTGVMTILNILFNYMFVFGKFGVPAMGVQGVAIASVLAWGFSLLLTLWIILFKLKIKVELPKSWKNFRNSARPILDIALPSSFEPLSWQFSQLVLTTMVIQMGELSLATRIYTINILFVAILYCFALSTGVQIKVAHLIGARRFDDAHNQLIQGVKLALGGSLAFVTAGYVFSDSLYGAFTENTEIWALGASVLVVAFFGEIGRSLNIVIGASLRAGGDARYVSVIAVFSMWLMMIPLAWALGLKLVWGLIGIWIAMSADELIRGLISLRRWNSQKWRTKGLYAKKKQVPDLAASVDEKDVEEMTDSRN